ncbi:MAG TPA: alpha/beta hydrolase [Solirubrobacteraceae bacterium]|nr:alpha/beta hydrolase [Solirubrobacteraceae bacterium]
MDARFTPAHRGGSGEPLVLLHGFTDTWRTWELVLPALERRHAVLAPTLAGHAGGRALVDGPLTDVVLDEVERAMDDAGFATAHIAGNSLGGYLALKLAERGRARSVVAFAPGGGWAPGDDAYLETLAHFDTMQEQLRQLAPRAPAILATPEGRRRAISLMAERWEHIPPDLIAHLWYGVVGCDGMTVLNEHARRNGWPLDAERVSCPVRIVWGTADRLLAWPRAAQRWRATFPHADWVELDGVGHAPQLDVPLEAAQLILGFTAP